jgi:hypothetical protein
MIVLMCWSVDDCVDVLKCWSVDVLMCWWLCSWLCWSVEVLMCKLMCWWLCWCVIVLRCWWLCWCVEVLKCWSVDDCVEVSMCDEVLMCDVLKCWCVDVLKCWWLCCCVDVLKCWSVEVLMCWCVDVDTRIIPPTHQQINRLISSHKKLFFCPFKGTTRNPSTNVQNFYHSGSCWIPGNSTTGAVPTVLCCPVLSMCVTIRFDACRMRLSSSNT